MIDNNRTNRTSTIRNTAQNRTVTTKLNTNVLPYTEDKLSILHKDIKNLVETTSVDTIAIIEENINNKIDDLYNKIDEDRRKDLDYIRNYIISVMGVGLTAIGVMDMIMLIVLELFK